jgi:hypothetical protein
LHDKQLISEITLRLFISPARKQVAEGKEGTTIRLKTYKGSKQRSREHCKAQTKAGGPCQAPALEGGLCFCHAHPERLAELGRQGGQKNRRWKADQLLPQRPLKNIAEVSELLEETINRVRQGPFDFQTELFQCLIAVVEYRFADLFRAYPSAESCHQNMQTITT